VATGGQQYLDLTGRLTIAPILEKDALLHIGGGGRYQIANSATGQTEGNVMFLGSNTRTEANILRENLIGTPDLSCGLVFGASAQCTRNITTFNAELAASYGPFNFQGEYYSTHYSRSAAALAYAAANGAGANALGGTSLNFNGFYAYGTWYLTGESRAQAYKVGALNSAEFGRIKILHPVSEGGIGAWEIGARYSMVDLNDGGIQGGRQEDFTVGLNWYPEKGVRLMANWIHVAHLSAPYNRPFLNGINPDIFLMRAQVDW
jgi:phosphate-selective porin OprO/OprP